MDDLGAHLHETQASLPLLRHGLAFLRQKPDVAVQTDRVDAHCGSVPQNCDHAGRGPQPTCAVDDDQHIRAVGRRVTAARLRPSVRSCRHLTDQLADPPGSRLVVGPEQDGGVLPFARPAVR